MRGCKYFAQRSWNDLRKSSRGLGTCLWSSQWSRHHNFWNITFIVLIVLWGKGCYMHHNSIFENVVTTVELYLHDYGSKTLSSAMLWDTWEFWNIRIMREVNSYYSPLFGHFTNSSHSHASINCVCLRKIHFHDVNLIEEFKNFDPKMFLTIKISMFKNSDPLPPMQK